MQHHFFGEFDTATLEDLFGVLDFKGNGNLTLDEFFRVYKQFYSELKKPDPMSSLFPIYSEEEDSSLIALEALLKDLGLTYLLTHNHRDLIHSWKVIQENEDVLNSFESFLKSLIQSIPHEMRENLSVREDLKARIESRARQLRDLASLSYAQDDEDPMSIQEDLLSREVQLQAEVALIDKLNNKHLDIQSSVPTNYLDEIHLLKEETQLLDELENAHLRLEDQNLMIKALKVRLTRKMAVEKSAQSNAEQTKKIKNNLSDVFRSYSPHGSTLNVLTKEPIVASNDADEFEEVDFRRKSQDQGQKEEISNQRVFKVVFVGDATVGKTSLVNRFCTGSFFPNTISTVGVDYRSRNVLVDNTECACVQFWDTAGQERYRSITRQYFRKADAVVIVYDISDEKSFLNIRGWLHDAREGAGKESVIVLLGNKVDLLDRKISYLEGLNLSHQFNASFQEVSALSGRRVEHTLCQMVQLLWEKEEDFQLEQKGLKLDIRRNFQKVSCCSGPSSE